MSVSIEAGTVARYDRLMPSKSSIGLRATLVVPTYNAMDFIDATIARLRRFVSEHPDWCVLFVCDGCTDRTAEHLSKTIENDGPLIRAEIYARNRGKGQALRLGLSKATTPFRIFTDADLAYDPDEALKILAVLEAGADVAVVNRASPDSCFLISPRDFPNIYKRHLMSRSFNWYLRRVLPIEILDTQAGLKGVTGKAWDVLRPRMASNGFFFDVELLARAQVEGLILRETPIVFRYADPTTVRMVKHGGQMFFDVLRLRRRLNQEKRQRRREEDASVHSRAIPINT
jgi:dolichyl-phosphate beta-glucosyltransferase